jgi:hypothetical protein
MASVSSKDKAPVEGMQKIDLTTLSIPQLAQLKQNLEQVSDTRFSFPFLDNLFIVSIGSPIIPRVFTDSEDCSDKVSGIC